MLSIEPFAPEDLDGLELQDAQAELRDMILAGEYRAALAEGGQANTMRRASGQVVACGGLAECWPGRQLAWMLVGERVHPGEWGEILEETRRGLDHAFDAGARRIEALVDVEHEAGINWIRRLGFTVEGLMRAYSPAGRDCLIYARLAPELMTTQEGEG